MQVNTLHYLRLLVLSAGLLITACSNQSPIVKTLTGSTMGTSYNIKLVITEDIDTDKLQQNIQVILDNIENQMSTYKSTSNLSTFNASQAQQWFTVPEEITYVAQLGLEISHMTDGAFDMTIGPAINLWNFGPDPRTAQIPSTSELEAVKDKIGYQHIKVSTDPPSLYKSVDAYLDLSAIAKGFAVDQVADWLNGQDIANYLIEVGGELKARGVKPDGSSWRIAIESPLVGGREIQKIINIEDASVATSGDYRGR